MNDSTIMRSDDLRAENRHRILRTLRKEGALSRAEVGKITGLSQAALSTLLGLMSDQGIVTSTTAPSDKIRRGRPQTSIALRADAALSITVSLIIDQLTICAIDYAGDTVSTSNQMVETTTLSEKQLNKLIINGIHKELKKFPDAQLTAISFGFQGATDSALGELLWSPIIAIERVPVAQTLRTEFGVPVSVNNDCSLIAASLYNNETESLGESFATILLSHGIGMGLYLSGQVFSGAQSSALEIGHIPFIKDGANCRCGKRGCIEAYAADYGILRNAQDDQTSPIPSKEVNPEIFQALVTAAHNNEPHAVEAFKMAGKAIGAGLVSVFTLFDPIPVALVGHNTEAVELMRPEIDKAIMNMRRSPSDIAHLLHLYKQDTPLLLDGLRIDALAIVDRELANATEDATSAQNKITPIQAKQCPV